MFKIFSILLTILISTSTWAIEDDCATLLVRLVIATKFMGGPYPSSLTRDYTKDGQTLVSLEFAVEPHDFIPPKMFITLPGLDTSSAKSLLENLNKDFKQRHRSAEIYDKAADGKFKVSNGMRSDTNDGALIFTLLNDSLMQHLGPGVQTKDKFEHTSDLLRVGSSRVR